MQKICSELSVELIYEPAPYQLGPNLLETYGAAA